MLSGDYSYSQENNVLLKALGYILQIKMLQQLREATGEVYSPSVQVSFNKYPANRFAVIITFGCAPENADHLVTQVENEMSAMRDRGISPDDIRKFKAAYEKTVEQALTDNSFWAGYLAGQYENDEDVRQVLSLIPGINKVTPETLNKAAHIFLKGDNMITFELLPETLN